MRITFSNSIVFVWLFQLYNLIGLTLIKHYVYRLIWCVGSWITRINPVTLVTCNNNMLPSGYSRSYVPFSSEERNITATTVDTSIIIWIVRLTLFYGLQHTHAKQSTNVYDRNTNWRTILFSSSSSLFTFSSRYT